VPGVVETVEEEEIAMQLDRRGFFRTLALVGVAGGVVAARPRGSEAGTCPRVPTGHTSLDLAPFVLESEVGDLVEGRLDLSRVERFPDEGLPDFVHLDLHVDTLRAGGSVREVTDKIEKLSLVHQELHRPPTALLTWGTGLAFKCILESFSTAFTGFLADGTPCLAICAARFQVLPDCEFPGPPPGA
jgi:hypothetical protein